MRCPDRARRARRHRLRPFAVRRPRFARLPPLALPLLLALPLWLAVAPPAHGEEPAVAVAFERGDLPPSHADRDAVEPALADALFTHTRGAWRFRAAAGGGGFPRLVVRVELAHGDWLFVTRFAAAADDPGSPWTAPFFTAAEVAERPGLPSPSAMTEALAERFATALETQGWLELNRGDLFVALQRAAPVAAGVQLVAGEPFALLQLSAAGRPRLADSRFRIDCRDRQGRSVEIYSAGTGACRPFPAPPPAEAIEVEHLEIRQAGDPHAITAADLGALGALTPGRVLLDRLGDDLGGCGMASPLVVGDLP